MQYKSLVEKARLIHSGEWKMPQFDKYGILENPGDEGADYDGICRYVLDPQEGIEQLRNCNYIEDPQLISRAIELWGLEPVCQILAEYRQINGIWSHQEA